MENLQVWYSSLQLSVAIWCRAFEKKIIKQNPVQYIHKQYFIYIIEYKVEVGEINKGRSLFISLSIRCLWLMRGVGIIALSFEFMGAWHVSHLMETLEPQGVGCNVSVAINNEILFIQATLWKMHIIGYG